MKDLIYAILLNMLLITSTMFAHHFVNEGWSLLFGIYCTVIGFNVVINIEVPEEYVFESVIDYV